MGDKSPKSKERGQKQKDAVKKQSANTAKNKQADQSGRPSVTTKK